MGWCCKNSEKNEWASKKQLFFTKLSHHATVIGSFLDSLIPQKNNQRAQVERSVGVWECRSVDITLASHQSLLAGCNLFYCLNSQSPKLLNSKKLSKCETWNKYSFVNDSCSFVVENNSWINSCIIRGNLCKKKRKREFPCNISINYH